MKEEILQYAWQYKIFDTDNLFTNKGEKVEVIDFGKRNNNAGPDFFNAKIRINGTTWAGNVEIHTMASDWVRHGHDSDPHYNSVILHAVLTDDYQAYRQDGNEIPTAVMKIDDEVLSKQSALCDERTDTKCAPYLHELTQDYMHLQMSKLLNDRLFAKSENILKEVKRSNGDWEQSFFIALAMTLGMGTNAMPFERLAKSFRLRDLMKHADDVTQIEAMLFGQAGLLEDCEDCDYTRILKREYKLLRLKFSLTPIDPSLWIYAKMRPVNFPHVRLAELSSIVCNTEHLFASILDAKDVRTLAKIFMVKASPFWDTHYTFGESSPMMAKRIGASTADSIIINAVVPTLFAYAQKRESVEYEVKAFAFLEGLRPERNSIITRWAELGVCAKNAYDTQALIELKKKYCNANDCLRCGFAHKILTGRKRCPEGKAQPGEVGSTRMADILSKIEREAE